MFTQAFLCYINRHTEIVGEGEKEKSEKRLTDGRRRGGTGKKKKIRHPFIPPAPTLRHSPSLSV